ncbi:hypothetical protein SAMN05444266_10572 [Chitinophaga jiangningensis]|uniref:Uncharacterized protein n=2 Tax=Chitinophaga jiangningensis TaxID=1419482 RepID=A0A1M7DP78_9BACT|nr:hypothetical protein SAMN05444266_10572 [Chitinophaga jiangningensis]
MNITVKPYSEIWPESFAISGLFVLLIFAFSTSFLIVLFFVVIGWLYWRLNKKRIYKLATIDNELQVYFTNPFKMETIASYPLNTLDYKLEEKKVQRGYEKDKVLTLYSDGRKAATMISRMDGWTKEDILEIAKGLNEAGVSGKVK